MRSTSEADDRSDAGSRALSEPLSARRCDHLIGKTWERSAAWLLLASPAAMILFILVAVLQGTLVHPEGVDRLYRDFAVWRGTSENYDTYFPLLRDLPTLFMALLLGPMLTVLHWQWHIMEQFAPQVTKWQVLSTVSSRDKCIVEAQYHKLNQALQRMKHQSRHIASAAVLALLIVLAELGAGTFGLFGPRGTEQAKSWSEEAYRGWWAAAYENPLGTVAYYCVLAFGLYYVIKLNDVGARFVYFYWRVRKSLKCHVRHENPDGYYGWLSFRRLLQSIFLSVSISASALTVLFLVLPLRQAVWILPLLLVFLLLNPVYIAVPLRMVHQRMLAAKSEAIAEVCVRLEEMEGSTDPATLTAKHLSWQEIDRIHAAPTVPFQARQLIFGLVVFVTPLATVAIEAYRLLRA